MTEADQTRRALLSSQRWAAETEKCDILKLEVLHVEMWEVETHQSVRAWAKDGGKMPWVLRAYLEVSK